MIWDDREGPQGTCAVQFMVIPLILGFELVKLRLVLLLQGNLQGLIAKKNPSMRLKCVNVRGTTEGSARK